MKVVASQWKKEHFRCVIKYWKNSIRSIQWDAFKMYIKLKSYIRTHRRYYLNIKFRFLLKRKKPNFYFQNILNSRTWPIEHISILLRKKSQRYGKLCTASSISNGLHKSKPIKYLLVIYFYLSRNVISYFVY